MTELHAPAATGPKTVEQLLAHAQINAVLVAYCQGVDRRDWDHVLTCYHEDAHEPHGQFVGTCAPSRPSKARPACGAF